MAAHKLDQLFRKKLAKHTSEPSVDAWTNMEAMLAQPKKIGVWFYYKIAAAVILILVAGLITFQNQLKEKDITVIAHSNEEIKEKKATRKATGTATEKVVENKKEAVKEEVKIIMEDRKKEVPLSVKKTPKATILFASSTPEIKENNTFLIKENSAEMAIGNLLASNDSMIYKVPEVIKNSNTETQVPTKKERKPIRIIYKRGNSSQDKALLAKNDTTSKKKFNFNSIRNASKNITSGDLMADIRDAKDSFFSQGKDFKKSNKIKNKNSNK